MSLSLLAILLFGPFRTFMIGNGSFSCFPPDRRIWEPPAMPPQQRTILLVDDDHEILESMRMVLESKGFRILAARDGNAGLMIAERENPDLLILDMMMPKKSGFLVLEKLRSRPGGLIPTIMITGNEGSRHRAYAEMLGVRDYIRKPFAMEKLIRAVERIMGIKSRSGEGDDDI
jgi:DNA-binding response OmpR family regulator